MQRSCTDAAYRTDIDGPHPLDHFVIVYWVGPYNSGHEIEPCDAGRWV